VNEDHLTTRATNDTCDRQCLAIASHGSHVIYIIYIILTMEAFNIKFVDEIEKHPELYNFTISEYSRKNYREKGWHGVSIHRNAINIRPSVFTHFLMLVFF